MKYTKTQQLDRLDEILANFDLGKLNEEFKGDMVDAIHALSKRLISPKYNGNMVIVEKDYLISIKSKAKKIDDAARKIEDLQRFLQSLQSSL